MGKAGAKTTASNSSIELRELAAEAMLTATLAPAGMGSATRIARPARKFQSTWRSASAATMTANAGQILAQQTISVSRQQVSIQINHQQ